MIGHHSHLRDGRANLTQFMPVLMPFTRVIHRLVESVEHMKKYDEKLVEKSHHFKRRGLRAFV